MLDIPTYIQLISFEIFVLSLTTSTTVLLSLLMVTFEGVYRKIYLNILECSSFLNLGLLSALAAVYQDLDYKEEVLLSSV